jgi:hypothetical protein
MPTPPEIIPTEDQEQQRVVEYCDLRGYPRFRIPNETFTRSWSQKRKNKSLGVSAGVPDLGVIVNNRLIFIEMKRIKLSATSTEQKEWIERLNAANVPARVCKGFDEAKAFIDEVAA